MNPRILFLKADVRGHMRGGKWVNAYTTKTPAAKPKIPAAHQHSLFGGEDHGLPAVKKPTVFHPKKDENGKPVGIHSPSKASAKSTWNDPTQVAMFTPGSPVPESLHGVPFTPWTDHPRTDEDWDYVDGVDDNLDEPVMHLPHGKTAASGVIIEEPDGRVWLVHPTNGFAGYKATFPKGGAEDDLSLQANAIKECFEEAGLQVEITGFFGDFERSTSVARYYTARRVGGTPAAMGWESQAVSLVPKDKLYEMLNGAADKPIAVALAGEPAALKGAEDASSWKKVGKQEGSNPGGFYVDDQGVEWYCKFPKTPDHARNEILASRLYKELGIRTPDMKLIKQDGNIGVASKVIDGLVKDPDGLQAGTVPGALEGFAADAWLANWDSVGLVYDNMLVDADGHAVRLDPGGSLLFRAQGAPKGDAFGDKVLELSTLRSGKNPQATAVFSNVTNEQLAEGVSKIAALTDKRIRSIVQRYGPGSRKDRDALAARLIKRRDDLVSKVLPREVF